MSLLIKLLMVVSGTAMYSCGELYNKNLKYAMGVPIAILGGLLLHTVMPMLCVITYLIACEFGYGDDNWLTKLLGKEGAITFCGFVCGLASFPIVGLYAFLGALIGAISWWGIQRAGSKINEPWVGILRGLSATLILLV